MATAFQASAFQNTAFQIVVTPVTPPTVGGGAPYAVNFEYKDFEELLRELAAKERKKKKVEKKLEAAVTEDKPTFNIIVSLDKIQGQIDQLKSSILAARMTEEALRMSSAMRRRLDDLLMEEDEDLLLLL